jgi:hypothetical protein
MDLVYCLHWLHLEPSTLSALATGYTHLEPTPTHLVNDVGHVGLSDNGDDRISRGEAPMRITDKELK